MLVINRILSPTPVFFQKLRNVGLLFTALAGVVLTSPLALPATIVSIAGYVGLAGGVMGVVSQLTVDGEGSQPVEAMNSIRSDTTGSRPLNEAWYGKFIARRTGKTSKEEVRKTDVHESGVGWVSWNDNLKRKYDAIRVNWGCGYYGKEVT